ncbi:SNF2 family N-terminal domain-containing protein, partial [Ochromonadaceae sp. CCMP2298]
GRNDASGCILAHCMGLGKTLTTIAFTATLLANPIITTIEDPYQPPLPHKHTSSSGTGTGAASGFFGPIVEVEVDLTSRPDSSPLAQPIPAPIRRKELFRTVLVVAPVNTLQNWVNEYRRWTPQDLHAHTNVVCIRSVNGQQSSWEERLMKLRNWHANGGVLIMGYDLFRTMTYIDKGNGKKKGKVEVDMAVGAEVGPLKGKALVAFKKAVEKAKVKASNLLNIAEAQRYLQNPGPDLVVADEAHIIKEKKSNISQVMGEIRTKRRIALTGSPLQNNLNEYWVMVNWVKPRFLYTLKEFKKRYSDKIHKGESKNASYHDKKMMKERTFLLNKKLRHVIDRRDMSELAKTLKPKREFTIALRMTSFQIFLYNRFLAHMAGSSTKSMLFLSFQGLQRIWNHPCNAVMYYHKFLADEAKKAVKDAKAKGSHKSKKPPHRIDLKYITNQLDGTFRHFRANDTTLLAEAAAQAAGVEKEMLKNATGSQDVQSSQHRDARDREDEEEDGDRDRDGGRGRGRDDEEDEDDEDDRDGDSAGSMADFIVDDDDEEEEEEGSDDESYDKKSARRAINVDDNDSGDSDYEEGGRKRKGKGGKGGKTKSKKIRLSDSSNNTNTSGERNKGGEAEAEKAGGASGCSVPVSGGGSGSGSSAAVGVEEVGLAGVAVPVVGVAATGTAARVGASAGAGSGTGTGMGTGAGTGTGPATATAGTGMDTGTGASTGTSTGAGEGKSTGMGGKGGGTEQEAVDVDDEEGEGYDEGEDEGDEGGGEGGGGNAKEGGEKEPTDKELEDLEREGKIPPDWWRLDPPEGGKGDRGECSLDYMGLLKLSNKMIALLSLLALSVMEGDKMSLYALNAIEMFLNMPNWGRLVEKLQPKNGQHIFSRWSLNREYLRIDGSSSGNRQKTIDTFNSSSRVKLMLISTKAGNMGINLQAANRVVIFDTSWNPVHDLQAVYRAYRYGQEKAVFVYRLLAAGSMEEKIYNMQVVKQSLSARVVDAQMPDNHFTDAERTSMMKFDVEGEQAGGADGD